MLNQKINLFILIGFVFFCQSCKLNKQVKKSQEINVLFKKRYDVYNLMIDDTIVILNQILNNGILKEYEYPLNAYLKDSCQILKEFVFKDYNKDLYRRVTDFGIFKYYKINRFSDSCINRDAEYEIIQEVNFKNNHKLIDTLFHFRICDEYKDPIIRDSIFYWRGLQVFKVNFYKSIYKDSIFTTKNEIINIEDRFKNPYQTVYYNYNGFIVMYLSNPEEIPAITLPYSIVYKRYLINLKK